MRKIDLLTFIPVALLLILPTLSLSQEIVLRTPEEELSQKRQQVACVLGQGGECLENLSNAIGKKAPELTTDMAILMKKLTKSITKVQGDLFENLITRNYAIERFSQDVKTCEDLSAKLPDLNYNNFNELKAMCNEPAVKRATEADSGFSLWPSDIRRKKRKQIAYHKELAEKMSALLLARQTQFHMELRSLEANHPIITTVNQSIPLAERRKRLKARDRTHQGHLKPIPQGCPNSYRNNFNYSYPPQDQIFKVAGSSYSKDELKTLTEGISAEGAAAKRDELLKKIAFTEEKLTTICDKDLYSPLAPGIRDFIGAKRMDPLAALTVFNSKPQATGQKLLDMQATFCKYSNLKSAATSFVKNGQWLYDGITLVVGFFGVHGAAVASVANVGLYSALSAQAFLQAEEMREKYVLSPEIYYEEMVTAENEAIAEMIRGGLIISIEGAMWTLPVVGRRVLGPFLKWAKAGTGALLAKLLEKGATIVGGKLLIRIGGKMVNILKDLPASVSSKILKYMGYLLNLPLAQKAIVSVRTLTEATAQAIAKYGKEKGGKIAVWMREQLDKKGNKWLKNFCCEKLMATGAGTAYVILTSPETAPNAVEQIQGGG